jgi:hypothetical protein
MFKFVTPVATHGHRYSPCNKSALLAQQGMFRWSIKKIQEIISKGGTKAVTIKIL